MCGVTRGLYNIDRHTDRSRKMCRNKEVRISRNTSRPGTTNCLTYFGRNIKALERSNTFDCLGNQPIPTPSPLRKTQSAVDLTKAETNIIPLAAKSLTFLWRRPARSHAIQDKPIELPKIGECTPVEDMKQRWRRQQIEIQRKNAAQEKTSIWSVLTGSRLCLSRKTRDQ